VDLEVLKKKISSYRTEGGHLTKVPDELVMEILSAWEQWTGSAKGFYSAVGVNQQKLAKIIGKAKKLKRDGHFPVEEFKEIKIEPVPSAGDYTSGLCRIELTWDGKQIIRFAMVDQLVDFLKKSGTNAA
jgi:hypothetical protein